MTRLRRTVFFDGVVTTCFLAVAPASKYPANYLVRATAPVCDVKDIDLWTKRCACGPRYLPRPTVIRVDVRYVDLACCGVEADSLAARSASAELAEIDGPNVVVVAGTVTRAAAQLVAEQIALTPEPRMVVAYGVCTITGGPYWDSYAVVRGIEADVVVPGCPPRPEALRDAVLAALS